MSNLSICIYHSLCSCVFLCGFVCVIVSLYSEKASVVIQDGSGDSVNIDGFGKAVHLLKSLKSGSFFAENLVCKNMWVSVVGG